LGRSKRRESCNFKHTNGFSRTPEALVALMVLVASERGPRVPAPMLFRSIRLRVRDTSLDKVSPNPKVAVKTPLVVPIKS
jgi:hypothetical protein